jgi:hypothetical protein
LGTSGASKTFAVDGQVEAMEFLRDSDLRSRYEAQAVHLSRLTS